MSFKFNRKIVHDLKEPIRSINALATLILDDETINDDVKGFAIKIKDRSLQLHSMIEAIRNLSAFNNEVGPKEEIDLNSLITSVIKSNFNSLKQIVVFEDELPTVTYNKSEIRRIFENLISNAIIFNDATNPLIKISSIRHNDCWTISISDNGVGIKDFQKDKVFDLFYATEPPNTKKGIGFGLTLVKHIVERNGGEIWFEANADRGTTFYFTIKI